MKRSELQRAPYITVGKTRIPANDALPQPPCPWFENRYPCKDGRIAHIMWSERWPGADQRRIAAAQVAAAAGRRQRIARFKYMVQRDELTWPPNRCLLCDGRETALAAARRKPCGLAPRYLDPDGFGQVNGMQGHRAGDRLLPEVRRRMKPCMCEADAIARTGGDECVLLPSIGIALYPDNGDNAEQLFRVADPAMYATKNARDRQVDAD